MLCCEQTDDRQITRRYMSVGTLARLIDADARQAVFEQKKVA